MIISLEIRWSFKITFTIAEWSFCDKLISFREFGVASFISFAVTLYPIWFDRFDTKCSHLIQDDLYLADLYP